MDVYQAQVKKSLTVYKYQKVQKKRTNKFIILNICIRFLQGYDIERKKNIFDYSKSNVIFFKSVTKYQVKQV